MMVVLVGGGAGRDEVKWKLKLGQRNDRGKVCTETTKMNKENILT